MKKQSIKPIIFTAVLCMSFIPKGTHAYFTDFDTALNPFLGGGNETDITEEFPPGKPITPEGNPVISKKIYVSNPSGACHGRNVDCYVRVRLSYSDMDIGKAVSIQGLDTKNWVKKQDGFYYYKPILKTGGQTTALCSSFSINGSQVETAYKDRLKEFTISVYEESVHAQGFSDYAEAWQFFDNPVGGK